MPSTFAIALRGEAEPARGSTTLATLAAPPEVRGANPSTETFLPADAQSAARLRELAELLQQAAAAPA
jgi:hypothetical protein